LGSSVGATVVSIRLKRSVEPAATST
jgi:hypothetical protein